MATSEAVPIIQHAIQLAVAPVFLLSGVAGLLAVMAGRLARIIDRARDLEQRSSTLLVEALAEARSEVVVLERRRVLASWAINLCTGAALLICLCIVTLFADEFLAADLRWLAGVLFVGAMIALVGGLTCFLREVYLATHASRIELHRFGR
ncbi:MAG TPA: DUF2721 domain-containing protein [Casimicrobiaceae bacterium]|nr:DUF2721 domain-containing protein [Casimicrobiaceae bacterium]